MKDITIKHTGYTCRGVSDLTLWGGDNACITMSEFDIQHLREIKYKINDAGFGVQKINGAFVDIYKNYCGFLVYAKSILVGKASEETTNFYYAGGWE